MAHKGNLFKLSKYLNGIYPFSTCLNLAVLGLALVVMGGFLHKQAQAAQQMEGYSIRFQGNGHGDIDRIKIPLQPQKPANVGAQDFTFEWWMKANPGDNTSMARCGENDGWIYGNILFDRDVWDQGDYGDYGIALNEGRIAFGVNDGANGNTVCASMDVADGSWHHVAVTREVGSGKLAIYVDGNLDTLGEVPTGNISYREGRATQYANDPFLVIGAEKHDAGAEYPSFKGWVDELRISNGIRYRESFPSSDQPFTPDELTIALFHFDEGPTGPCTGDVLDATGMNTAFCQYGGATEPGPVYDEDEPFGTILSTTETATPIEDRLSVTITQYPSITDTATVTITPMPVELDNNLVTDTPPAPENPATPVAVTETVPIQTPTDKTSVSLLMVFVLVVGGAAVVIFLIRPKK